MNTTINDEFSLLPKSKIKAGEGIEYGKYPFYTSSDIKISSLDSYEYDDEAVILGTGGKASCNYVKGKFSFSTDNYVLKTNGKVETKFLYYFLRKNNLSILQNGFHGAGLQHIGKEYILNIKLPLFDKEKQNLIINNLDSINKLILNQQKQLNLLDELIKSRFIELFMDDEKDRYPLKKWNDVVTVKHGKDYKKNLVESGGYPVYGSGGFMGVYADNYLVNENATIIGRKGTIDKPILVKEKFWNVDTAFGIEVNTEYLNPVFFYVRSTLYDLKSMSTSTTLPSMTQSTLHNIDIGVPPIELQNEFAEFVKLIDKSKFVVQKRIELYKELLNKKMDEYFN